ncbi:MAG: 50S ribosomal protein L17 [bacterium]|nr:50S ribosomal protein L17 [bacterium]
MRHRKHTSKLNRTSEHRAAMLRNLAIALVTNERIRTTHAKATQLRPFLEGLVTLAKEDTVAARRLAMARVGDRNAVVKLFSDIAPRVAQRAGGYLRIVKDAPRVGDGALMSYVEFVDPAPQAVPGEEKPAARKTIKQRLHERRKEMAKIRR